MLKLIGLLRAFPSPDSGILLTISPLDEKKVLRPIFASDIANAAATQSERLDNISGKFPFTQTFVFGGYGRTMLNPIYDKLQELP